MFIKIIIIGKYLINYNILERNYTKNDINI